MYMRLQETAKTQFNLDTLQGTQEHNNLSKTVPSFESFEDSHLKTLCLLEDVVAGKIKLETLGDPSTEEKRIQKVSSI